MADLCPPLAGSGAPAVRTGRSIISEVPEIADRAAIRSILRSEPYWSVYALGDLAPGYFEHSEWHAATAGPPALVLLYRAVTPPVLFALGPPPAIAALAEEIADPAVHLHVREEAARALTPFYRPVDLKPMVRMALETSRFERGPEDGTVRLGQADAPRLDRLYADGRETGESPDFFFPSMIGRGVFFGIEEGGELVAAAGTHLVVPEEGVGAIGNVYTRRDRRGRGLAGRVTGAVARELLRAGVRWVALHVNRHNSAAIRVYQRLGFVTCCEFVEGLAVREG
jgi:ribosomal protein S18 acetylase RimI-like enzyme